MTSPGRTTSSSTRRGPLACPTGCSRREWRLRGRLAAGADLASPATCGHSTSPLDADPEAKVSALRAAQTPSSRPLRRPLVGNQAARSSFGRSAASSRGQLEIGGIEPMTHERTKARRVSAGRYASALGAALLWASAARAGDYPAMAPLDQYFMDRSAEIALAKSAAPPSIADKATVLVLTPHGYETAVSGSNGFVCAVERAWMSQYDFPGFWNPRMRGPLCFNPPAARSILPYTIKRTELVLAGRTKAQMIAAIADDIREHALPPLEAGPFTPTMSKQGHTN